MQRHGDSSAGSKIQLIARGARAFRCFGAKGTELIIAEEMNFIGAALIADALAIAPRFLQPKYRGP
jgi:hypothetical protein